MSAILAVARREAASMLRVPAGWVVIALFLLLTSMVFAMTLAPGAPASLRSFFEVSAWLLMPVAPAISMRLLADEHRSGTGEMLMTGPISDAGIVAGKYLGALGFLALMLLPTLAFPAVLWTVSDPAPDAGPVVAGYLSLILQGALYLAIGLAISAMTSSQMLAYLATLFPILALLLLSRVSSAALPGPVYAIVSGLSIQARSADFARGIIDSSHVVFFICSSGACLFIAHAALGARRIR